MGTCQSNNTINTEMPAEPTTVPAPERASRVSSNPFYDYSDKQFNDGNGLSKYQFHSKYKDTFLGDCSVIQEKSTGDLYLCKEIQFSDQQQMKEQVEQLESRQRSLTSENVIQIKQVITKSTDGFFGDVKKALIIVDYPFMSFQRQIANRIVNKISFSKEEVLNFLNSTVKGYAAIERAGFRTDKVRLKNIFVGIKNKQSVIKVAQNSLIEPKSNFEYMIDDGPNKLNNRDIYLSPQQYLAWADDNEDYKPNNKKSGVYSLGMCLLDVCIMDPSRQMYHYTQKQIDQVEVKNRIEIAGKKYGGSIQKILRQMLQVDPTKRASFADIEAQLPTLTRNTMDLSKMHLSVIPSQKSNYINNDNTSLRSSQMFKSIVSNVNSGSRVFASRIKMDQSRMREQQVLDITEHYTNGNKYFGQKKGNMKHGKGRYDLADGSYFDGEWTQNKINGKGILYFKNGKPEYDGEWRNDLYNGWGTLYSQIGSWNKYEGQFRNGVKEGRGRMYFKDGSMYDGEFRGDKISGRGRKINANGEVVQKYWDTISPQLFS